MFCVLEVRFMSLITAIPLAVLADKGTGILHIFWTLCAFDEMWDGKQSPISIACTLLDLCILDLGVCNFGLKETGVRSFPTPSLVVQCWTKQLFSQQACQIIVTPTKLSLTWSSHVTLPLLGCYVTIVTTKIIVWKMNTKQLASSRNWFQLFSRRHWDSGIIIWNGLSRKELNQRIRISLNLIHLSNKQILIYLFMKNQT